ncbi:hypothetical protein [Streptomyces syringium]|uniref:hypothetical protein n=1 Tax=Streptomyces syringium TaxID=76729 RepID=UPI00345468C3
MFPIIALPHTGRQLLLFAALRGAVAAFLPLLAVTVAYLPELYEPQARCTGMTLCHNHLSRILGGSLTPLVATATARTDGPPRAVASCLTAVALFSLGRFALLPEIRSVTGPA